MKPNIVKAMKKRNDDQAQGSILESEQCESRPLRARERWRDRL
jgi:hypothetical protein